jgi:hypothetical protein
MRSTPLLIDSGVCRMDIEVIAGHQSNVVNDRKLNGEAPGQHRDEDARPWTVPSARLPCGILR